MITVVSTTTLLFISRISLCLSIIESEIDNPSPFNLDFIVKKVHKFLIVHIFYIPVPASINLICKIFIKFHRRGFAVRKRLQVYVVKLMCAKVDIF
jgi:hypothetical protein